MMKLLKRFVIILLFLPLLVVFPGTGTPGQNFTTKKNFSDFDYYVNSDVYGELDYDFNNRAPVFGYATKSTKINSPFGWRYDPISGIKSLHNGTDFACRYGEPIYASAPGKVVISSVDPWGSLVIEIQHSKGISTRYLHQQKNLVEVGDIVARGEQIAECGATGYATGSHCHLGLKIDGEFVDIVPYIKRK